MSSISRCVWHITKYDVTFLCKSSLCGLVSSSRYCWLHLQTMALQQHSLTTEENPLSPYADAVRSQDLQVDFQLHVLSMLGGLRTDMQSMGYRVSHLEPEQAQSAQTRTPKEKSKAPISAAKSATPTAVEHTTTLWYVRQSILIL